MPRPSSPLPFPPDPDASGPAGATIGVDLGATLGTEAAEPSSAHLPAAVHPSGPASGDGTGAVATLGSGRTSQGPRLSVLPDVAGGRLVPPSSPRLRYEPGAKLGQGATAEVRVARDTDIGRTIAVKRLRPDRRGHDTVLRFIEEIRVVGRLEHPNIVPIHDVGMDEDGSWFFVMRHVPGEPLSAIIARLARGDAETHARFGVERRLRLFTDIAEAVAYAHAHGVLHRDLKPDNVLVTPDGQAVVVDWGLARASAASEAAAGVDAEPVREARPVETRVGAVLGTPLYMAPEQARGEPATARSEVYTLGVLLHELLFLRHYLADRHDTASVLAGVQSVTPSMVKPGGQAPIPTELLWILGDCLAKEPARRIRDVQTLLARLRRRAEGDIEVHCAVTFAHRANRRVTRLLDARPGLAFTLLGAGAGVVLLGLAGWFV